MQLRELIGRKITNIYQWVEYESYGMDHGACVIELDNNLIIMFDDNFFIKLEWEIIPNALAEIANPDARDFWCDGVMAVDSEFYYTKKFVNDNRYVPFLAYIGKEGETKYELILSFGRKALSRYARDLSIEECIPATDASEWFSIDVQQQIIEIQLL